METLQEQLELFEKPDSDEVITRIHKDVKEQLRACMDWDIMREIEPWMNFWAYNFLTK